MSAKIQYAFVAREVGPVLAVALDSRLRPQRMVLMYTPDFLDRARWLAEVLEAEGIRCVLEPVPSAFDPATLLPAVEQIVQRHGSGLINLSCGTQVMGIIGATMMGRHGLRGCYLKPDDQLVWLDDIHRPGFDVEDRMGVDQLLAARGWRVIEREDASLWRRLDPLYDMLRHGRTTTAQAFNLLGQALVGVRQGQRRQVSYAVLTEVAGRQTDCVLRKAVINQAGAVLDRLASLELVQADRAGGRWMVPYEVGRYFRGECLEHMAYRAAMAVKQEDPRLQSVHFASKVIGPGQGSQELDLILMYDNKLFIVECKQLVRIKGEVVDYLYKLDALRKTFGGQMGQGGLLISLLCGASAGKYASKAASMGLQLWTNEAFRDLEAALAHWLAQGR